MHRMETISSALQMYLKTILQLQAQNKVARVKEIADKLNVTGATVSNAIKTLEEQGLVKHERYGYITLTDHGQFLADCVQKRFHVLQQFLIKVLEVDPETADADACLMEHDISPITLNRLAAFVHFIQSQNVGEPSLLQKFEEYLRDPKKWVKAPLYELCDECVEAAQCKLTGQKT